MRFVSARSARLKTATVGTSGTETFYTMGGLLTDEWKSGDTFSQRVETDQRTIQSDNADVASFYQAEQQARGAAKDAIEALRKFLPDPTANIAQMYWAMGLVEMQLSEAFCNGVPFSVINDGVPTYSNPMTNAEGYVLALAHIDSGLALATATDTFAVNTQVQPARDQGSHPDRSGQVPRSGSCVGNGSDRYRWYMTFSHDDGRQPDVVVQLEPEALGGRRQLRRHRA